MAKIFVLFNLRNGISRGDYEDWARGTDMPAVRALGSVDGFTIHRSVGLLGGGEAPYKYVEMIEVADMDGLMQDISEPPMPEIAEAFQRFADNPIFIVTEDLG